MSGVSAEYRIGPSDFFTPDDLLADAATLNRQVNELDGADWTAPPQDLYDAFFAFVPQWRGFYSSNFSGWGSALLAALNDGNRDQLIQFEASFLNFAQRYADATGKPLPDVVQVSSGAKDTLGAQIANQLQPLIPSVNIGHVLVVAGLVVAGLVAFYFRGPLARALKAGSA